MRGTEAEDHVERLRGLEALGFPVVQDKAVLDTELARRGRLPGQGVLGDVHALGVHVRSCGHSAQEPSRSVLKTDPSYLPLKKCFAW